MSRDEQVFAQRSGIGTMMQSAKLKQIMASKIRPPSVFHTFWISAKEDPILMQVPLYSLILQRIVLVHQNLCK